MGLLLFMIPMIPGAPQIRPPDDRPHALVAAEHSRNRIGTGHLEWKTIDHRNNRQRHFTSKIAQNGYIIVDCGDEKGVVFQGKDGKPADVTYNNAEHTLMIDGVYWEYVEQDPSAFISDRAPYRVVDVRTLGLNLKPTKYFSVDDVLCEEKGSGARSYSTTMEDDLYVVSVQSEGGVSRTYWIDPKRGFCPVRVAVHVERNGVEWGTEARIVPKEFDGVWFPESVAYYRTDYEKGERPYMVATVSRAEFNRPEQAPKFTPEHIGIEVGTNIRPNFGEYKGVSLTWGGDKLITRQELYKRMKAGELKFGPNYTREAYKHIVKRKDMQKRTLRDRVHESAWEAHTRGFIKKYHLDDEQSQKAWAILKDCQERAEKHLRAHREEIAELLRKLDELERAGKANKETPESKRLGDRRRQLAEPIDRIFNEELRPRLDRLPTRKQREALRKKDKELSGPIKLSP